MAKRKHAGRSGRKEEKKEALRRKVLSRPTPTIDPGYFRMAQEFQRFLEPTETPFTKMINSGHAVIR